MTLFLTYRPKPPLSEYVNIFWLSEGYKPPHKMERVLPDGHMELIINLEEDTFNVYDQRNHEKFKKYRGSLIAGPHSEYVVIDTSSQSSTMGVHFKPGGVFPFFKLPVNELCNVHVSLETLWGNKANHMREQILEVKTPDAKFRVLERYLSEALESPLELHPAVAFALEKFKDSSDILDICEQINLSPRRFIQVFKEAVGLTPKRFCRVQRFQEVLYLIEQGKLVDWTSIAIECGYYDQAHFIHDFRSFSGLSPTTYQALRGDSHNHVPIRK
ncbi:AraC family transcriptional regulator [Bacillus sp. IITD106]|nr:AraC family transcriptional regulator [Bacillus sp. IITD106]